jgi:hypothetical protein
MSFCLLVTFCPAIKCCTCLRHYLQDKLIYFIIPFRFEAAAYPASLPGRVKSYFYCAPFGCTPGQRITRRQGGGDEFTYVEEADDDANKVSQRPGAHPAGKRIANKFFTSPVITACKMVAYKRIGMRRILLLKEK